MISENNSILISNKNWTEYSEGSLTMFFIGYLEYKEGIVRNAQDLYSYFNSTEELDSFKLFLKKNFLPYCNGNFAMIIQLGETVIAITDYLRNFQINFLKVNDHFMISDHINSFDKEYLVINDVKCEEFIISGFVAGNDTVFNDCYSLQPCEILTVNKDKYEIIKYFNFISNPFKKTVNLDKNSIYLQMDELFIGMFKRMIKSAPNVGNWIVPLSGGHDSRLIINYLYQLGCKNVICFTYGDKDSYEIDLSKQIASALGFEWHFVDYFSGEWSKLHNGNIFDDFVSYAFNGCNLPHTQDLLALKVLSDKGIFKEGDVVVPGHTAFTESEARQITDIKSENEAIEYVFSKYYKFFKTKKARLIKERLKVVLKNNHQTAQSFTDFFNWQERQVKFIGNSVRAYEFNGLEWRMPFWEKEIIDFWQSLKYEDRIERKIFIEASRNKLFVKELRNIPIINKFHKVKHKSNIISRIIPIGFKSFIASSINWESKEPVGTNQTFNGRGKSIKEILEPINRYPLQLKKYINPFLVRKPYQMNVNALMVFYTLGKEVFSKVTKH